MRKRNIGRKELEEDRELSTFYILQTKTGKCMFQQVVDILLYIPFLDHIKLLMVLPGEVLGDAN